MMHIATLPKGNHHHPFNLTPVSVSKKKPFFYSSPRSLTIWASAASDDHEHIHRRRFGLILAGTVLGSVAGCGSAGAAGRRQQPPPPEERKDPNLSGVAAKVLASKKRKEAMKELVAKLKEKGKVIQEPSLSL